VVADMEVTVYMLMNFRSHMSKQWNRCHPNWSVVSTLTGHGSGVSYNLCVELGVNPDANSFVVKAERKEWDALSKKEMWDELQAIRSLVDDDGTHGGPVNVVASLMEELAALRAERLSEDETKGLESIMANPPELPIAVKTILGRGCGKPHPFLRTSCGMIAGGPGWICDECEAKRGR